MDDLLVFETEHFTVGQARSFRLPGYLIIEAKAQYEHLDELSNDAAKDLVRCLGEAERLVHEIVAPERVYTLRFGEMQPRIHFHVIPRTARVAAAFVSETGATPPYSGALLVDWLWRRHEILGYTDGELRSFVVAARALHGE